LGNVACALIHQFGDDALELFHDYSPQCPEKYNPQATINLWRSIRNQKGKILITSHNVLQFANRSKSSSSIRPLIQPENELDDWFPKSNISSLEPRALNYVIDDFIAEGIFVITGAPGTLLARNDQR
jgi:hypothetical protein